MKKVLTVAAVAEVATGMALLIVPSLVGRLLFGEELTGIVIPVARVLGIALLALGVGCWPDSTAFFGMLTYSALVTLYLLYLATGGERVGPLLWPVIALHAILTALLARGLVSGSPVTSLSRTNNGGIATPGRTARMLS
jgi:hypothetical protein